MAPNLLNRDFTATRLNEKWVGDITAIWTYEGWLYLAAVLDLFSRKVVGWTMAANQDESLVEMAFRMALLQRRPQAGWTPIILIEDVSTPATSTSYSLPKLGSE